MCFLYPLTLESNCVPCYSRALCAQWGKRKERAVDRVLQLSKRRMLLRNLGRWPKYHLNFNHHKFWKRIISIRFPSRSCSCRASLGYLYAFLLGGTKSNLRSRSLILGRMSISHLETQGNQHIQWVSNMEKKRTWVAQNKAPEWRTSMPLLWEGIFIYPKLRFTHLVNKLLQEMKNP